ncbi:hypothetical protein ESCO_006133 [Escovopsis weberi]|uniref:Cytochrome b561 domain-containing protein n=1 Tax=Escovopsis weberi TaxID=150374 RepID=A0A0M9VUZ9_ESCWE|nr:hypothetical protein ESCO_006133 [Escovopsis weberi]
MLLNHLGRVALVVAALAPLSVLAAASDNPPGQSTFISPDGSLAFAFTVPDNNNLDVYFSLRVAKKRSWGAIGLGSNEMSGALFLMLYQNEAGTNVTFSPRLAYGNYEPQFYPDLEVDVLDGTGIVDNDLVFHARCRKHCRSWPSGKTSKGYIDVSSPNSKAIYAIGPEERFKNDAKDAPLKMHEEYGSFTIDMKRTQGRPHLPVLTEDSENEGTTLSTRTSGRSDWKAIVHGVFMIVAFIALLPGGAIMVRVEKLAKFHKFVQAAAVLLILAAFGLAIPMSFYYQRSRSFRSLHQLFGYFVVFCLMIQLALGVLNHLQMKKSQQPGLYSTLHRWVGRFTVFMGAMNGYIGFRYAGDARWAILVTGIVFFIIFCFLAYAVVSAKGQPPQRTHAPGGFENYSHGYQPQPQPWRQHGGGGGADVGAAPSYPHDPPPGYEAPSAQQIGLQSVSPWRSASPTRGAYEDEPGGSASIQKPREFA